MQAQKKRPLMQAQSSLRGPRRVLAAAHELGPTDDLAADNGFEGGVL
jgi:hypothetical protein